MRTIAAAALILATTACDLPADPPPPPGNEIDQALLATYKRAVPKKASLVARLPESAAGAGAAVGDAAQYPQMAVPHVANVNTLIGNILDTVEAVTETPPTLYSSETAEFLWGPFDNADSPLEGDKAIVYIRDKGPDAEFHYEFAFARMMGEDVATAVPVIFGAVNPDEEVEDQGSGVLLLDFAASRAFAEANGGVTLREGRGRFATAFFRGPDENGSGNTHTVVVGSFRGFAAEDGAETADVDHLWGRVDTVEGNTIDFIDLSFDGNILDQSTVQETLDMQLVAFNGGLGRGEALLTGGDAGDNIGSGVECWNAAVERQFYEVTLTDGQGTSTVIETNGDATTGCPAPFNGPLAELNIPTLDTIDAGILTALQNAAENGL